MTGGAEKIFGEAQINFSLIFGRENQKKFFILAVYLFSGHKSRSGAPSLRDGARRNLMVQILLFAYKFRVENQKKKRSMVRNLRLSLGVRSCFSSWNETLLTLGGHRPQNALQWHRAYYCLSGHNLRLRSTLLAWGAQAVI